MSFFSPSGRIGRGGWWLCQLVVIGIWIVFSGVVFTSGMGIEAAGGGDENVNALVALGIVFLGVVALTAWINIASCIRRYHDRGKGWHWYFVAVVPFIGPIIQVAELGFFPGQPYDNSYGPAIGENAGGNAFDKAQAEFAGKKKPSRLRKKEVPLWQRRVAESVDEDATAHALRTNKVQYSTVTGEPRAAFGVRND